jgi:hypothetical protein
MKTLRFGIEIETADIRRSAAIRVIQGVAGGRVRHEGGYLDRWTVEMADGRKWAVCSDSSIRCRFGGCEVVSPVLKYEDIEQMQEIVRALRRAGARVTTSSGIHVHVDQSTLTVKAVCNLVKIWNRQEKIISAALANGHRRTWCREQNSNGLLRRILNKKPKSWDKLGECYYNSRNVHGRGHYDGARYKMLNLHNIWSRPAGRRTVEFRCFNSTLHAGKVKAYVQFVLAMVAKAKRTRGASTAQKALDTRTAKYDMRVFLIKLDLIGNEFKTCRKWLTENLPGSSRSAGTGRSRGGATRRMQNRVAMASAV